MEEKNLNLERYAKDEMTEEERLYFEKKMSEDESLVQDAQFYKEMANTISLKERIKSIDAALEADKFFENLEIEDEAKLIAVPSSRRLGRNILRYAASLLVLFIAGSLWFANVNYSNNQLANLDIQGLGLLEESVTRNRDSNKDIFEEGIIAFREKNYEVAISFFENISASNESYSQSLLYLTTAQLELRDYDAAINNALQAIDVTSSTKNRQKLEWILVKAQIGNEKMAESKSLLQKIASDDNHAYQKDAQNLQEQLKSPWRSLIF